MSDINRRRMRQPKGRSSYKSQSQSELDRFLEGRNLWRKHIAKDGSCLFRAVAEQVYLSQVDHLHVRRECVEYIRQHQGNYKEFLEEPVDSYLFKLCHPTSWAGEIELSALAEIYHRRIVVYHYHSNQVALKSFGPEKSPEPTIQLAYSDGNHYDSIMTKEYRNNSAICQSILYEMLFESVLQVSVPDRKDLQQYTSRQHRDYLGDSSLKNFCSDDLMAFSSRIYFNAALGVHKTYREDLESQDWQIAMAMQFQEGDECQVWIDLHRKEKKLFDGVIRATNTSKGKHRVFINDLKKTMEVKHQDFNVLSLVGGRRPSHIKNSDWLFQQNKKKAIDKPSSGRREKGSQGKLSIEKSRTTTYLMASHRKKREQVMANSLESDEVDPEIQEQLRLIELQDKDNSFPALSSQAVKVVTESYNAVTSQSVTSSSSTMVTSIPPVTTTIAGSLPSSVMPKVKPIQKPSATTGQVVSIQPAVTLSQSQAASTRQQPKNSHRTDFMSSNDSPLNSTEEFFSAKNVKAAAPNSSLLSSGSKEFFSAKNVTTAPQITSMMVPKATIAVKENQLVLHDGPVQQHTDVAKQLMQVIHQEKESQQSSERQLMTLSMTMSSNSSTDLHSSWPELLSQDEQRAMPLNMQDHQGVAPPTLSTIDLSSASISKSPYATQALPTANTITHMPSTAVKVAKAPPSFFTTTIAPPTTGQATPTTKAAQGTMTAMRTSIGMASSGVQALPSNRVSMVTGSQATPTKKVHAISAIGNQATTINKTLVTGGLAMPTSNRTPPTQYQNFSGLTGVIKTSGFASATIAPPTTTVAGSLPTVTGAPHVTSPKALNLELPLVHLPNPPLQLFQDGENGYFFEQYGRMCFAILLEHCPDITHLIHGVEAKLSEKTHSHDIDYSEEERRLIEEQSQRLESWKRSSTGILHSMKDLQGPPQSEKLMVNITKPTGLPTGETMVSSPQDGARKLQIVFPSLKEPTQQEDSAVKEFGTQEKDKHCFKNLNKEELEMLHSLMKKLDFHQLQSDTTAAGGASSDETISAHTTSSLPPSDTEGTLSTASEPTAQPASPIQTAPETHPSESQSAESSTSPDVDPSLQPTSEGANQEDTAVDTDASTTAEKPGEEKAMEHQHNNLDSEGTAFTPGMMPAHNPMAAMATMGHFIPPAAAAAGFMPTMLPAPMNPYMMVPQNIYLYHQFLQQAHYNQVMQQTMAAAALNSPTMLSSNQEEGSFFQQKDTANPSLQDAHTQAMDPVEVTANTNHTDSEQLRGNSPLQGQDDFTSSPSSFPVSSVNLHFDRVTQGINMAPSSFTGTTPIVANSLPLSAEDNMSINNSQLQFATDEHQTANVSKDLFKVLPPKVPVVPSQSEPVSTDISNKTNHTAQRELSNSYASYHNTSSTMAGSIKANHTSMCKPQSNKQDNTRPSSNIHQRAHHSKYDGRSIDHELSQMGMHNNFPNGIPSMVFSSEKRRKSQQT